MRYYSRVIEEQINHVNGPNDLAVTLIHNNIPFIAESKGSVWEFTVKLRNKRVLDVSIQDIESLGKNQLPNF